MQNTYNLKKIRDIYNFNQSDLAEVLGITREYVNKMENGKAGVKKKVALKLRQLLESKQADGIYPDSLCDQLSR